MAQGWDNRGRTEKFKLYNGPNNDNVRSIAAALFSPDINELLNSTREESP